MLFKKKKKVKDHKHLPNRINFATPMHPLDGFLCPMLLQRSVGKFTRFGTYLHLRVIPRRSRASAFGPGRTSAFRFNLAMCPSYRNFPSLRFNLAMFRFNLAFPFPSSYASTCLVTHQPQIRFHISWALSYFNVSSE